VSKLANQWIDLFRAGDYTGSGKGAFTEQDLDDIVNNYDPAHYEAPTTIGHPKANSKEPAYGWWSALRRVGNLLQGKMGTVQPEFEEALGRELYKKRSVGLAKGDKGWSLHHVAWLGAQAPHIKGLADFKFEESIEATEIDFSEEMDMALDEKKLEDSLFTRLTAFFAPKPNVTTEVTPKTFSEEDVQRIAKEAAEAAVAAQVNPLKTQFSEREKTLSIAETKSRAEAAIGKVKTAGAWVPAFEKMGLTQIFEELAGSTETVDFAEGNATVKRTKLEIFTSFMEGLKQIVPASPVWTGQGAVATAGKSVGFNESPNVVADRNSVMFAEKIDAYMVEHKESDYRAAMRAVAAKHPELTVPGGASAGSV
jgi:hypothetical protein